VDEDFKWVEEVWRIEIKDFLPTDISTSHGAA
jgi:hypothetical protein